MPAHKLMSLPDAVRRFARNGMIYASGAALPIGSDAVVFGREMVRQGLRDLHTIFHCNTQQLNLLAANGNATKAECGFSGHEPLDYGFAGSPERSRFWIGAEYLMWWQRSQSVPPPWWRVWLR